MTTTFKDAYGVLQRHAETLRVQNEPNIDDLLTIVTESVDAYKVCQQRIEAVEAALKAALDGVGTEGPATPAPAPAPARPPARATAASRAAAQPTPPPAPPATPASFDDMDDDIPF